MLVIQIFFLITFLQQCHLLISSELYKLKVFTFAANISGSSFRLFDLSSKLSAIDFTVIECNGEVTRQQISPPAGWKKGLGQTQVHGNLVSRSNIYRAFSQIKDPNNTLILVIDNFSSSLFTNSNPEHIIKGFKKSQAYALNLKRNFYTSGSTLFNSTEKSLQMHPEFIVAGTDLRNEMDLKEDNFPSYAAAEHFKYFNYGILAGTAKSFIQLLQARESFADFDNKCERKLLQSILLDSNASNIMDIDYQCYISGSISKTSQNLFELNNSHVRVKNHTGRPAILQLDNSNPASMLSLYRKIFTKPMFLDHDGYDYHGEVFYPAANLVSEFYRPLQPAVSIVFLVTAAFANHSGIDELWHRYAVTSGNIPQFSYEIIDVPEYSPVSSWRDCSDESSMRLRMKYHLRVIVTLPKLYNCMVPFANDSTHLMIIHHLDPPSSITHWHWKLVGWSNVYIASNLREVAKLTDRHFTPSLLPLPRGSPVHDSVPVFIVQGDLLRRDITELEWLLTERPALNISVRILTRSALPPVLSDMNDSRIDYRNNLNTTEFHEAFIGAHFMLPLIGIGHNVTSRYLHLHPTSSIAFGVHFRLHFVMHEAVFHAYEEDLQGGPTLYLHDGSQEQAIIQFHRAISDFKKARKKAIR
eukprot:gene28360-37422_t